MAEVVPDHNQMPTAEVASAKEGEKRDWAGQPSDVLMLVFEKSGVLGFPCAAQFVCCKWKRTSLQSQIWSSVQMWRPWDGLLASDLERVTRNAIDRACGIVVDQSIEGFATKDRSSTSPKGNS
ncbi:hypothetical protein QJS10_CPA09g00684 [Acorus calamus]|uniref:F-box domain-containing protein n=1 Tax=Acorus calamus TaxID=4465 RepID=A0AAV9E490_ACOCL|nr:hypothetical protein QJS10_CPA09g00684 [Acorus calamus]